MTLVNRIDAQPLLDWLGSEDLLKLRLPYNEYCAYKRAQKKGYVNFFMADRIACALGHPELMRVLYDDDAVAA